MPRGESSDIPHTRFTDHYIRVVRPEGKASPPPTHPRLLCATEPAPDSALVGEAYLKWYNEENPDPRVLQEALRILERYGRPAALAQGYLQSGAPARALPLAEKALRADTSLQRMELYGYLLEMTGQQEKALQVWETLRQRAPAYPEAHFRYVLMAYQLGRLSPERAYEELIALTKEQPWNPQFHYNAAVLAGVLGRLEAVRIHLRTALACDPDYRPAQEAWRRLS